MVDEHHATIQVLSDNVLLRIFAFLRPHWGRPHVTFVPAPIPTLTWAWHRLAHVCRRWRCLVFASSRHLGLGLVTSRERLGTTLGLWPPLPICITYDSHDDMPSLEDEQDIIATLEHSDRCLEINLKISNSLSEKSNVWMEPFPELERLCLRSPSEYCQRESTVLPSGFLGGSTLSSRRLRYIVLERISVPTLPHLLLSSCGLVHLFLGKGVLEGDGFHSPAVLSAALSTAARLESLHLHLPSDIFYKAQESADSELHPPNLVDLPALTYFNSEGHGSNEYLEDFVSRIRAPLLEQIYVRIPYEHARPNMHLSQFISRTERMSALPSATYIHVEEDYFMISHHFENWGSGHISFELTCDPGSLQEFQVDHICSLCKQLTPLISDVNRVSIYISIQIGTRSPPDEVCVPQWLRLFRLFDGAQDLQLGTDFSLHEELETAEIGEEVLPALKTLQLDIGRRVPRVIKSFIAKRKLAGRRLTVTHRRPCRGADIIEESE
jgi:hypothetical protein